RLVEHEAAAEVAGDGAVEEPDVLHVPGVVEAELVADALDRGGVGALELLAEDGPDRVAGHQRSEQADDREDPAGRRDRPWQAPDDVRERASTAAGGRDRPAPGGACRSVALLRSSGPCGPQGSLTYLSGVRYVPAAETWESSTPGRSRYEILE